MKDRKVEMTVVFVIKEGKILLAIKTRKIGKGHWNGYGGKVEPGEGLRESAIRELKTESGLTCHPDDLEKVGIVEWENTESDGLKFTCTGHIYITRKFQGTPSETGEMANPTWFDIDNIPFDNMMPADKVWLPLILQGRKILAYAKYGPGQKEIIGRVSIQEVSAVPE